MDDDAAHYDEFSMLKQYADHEGIEWSGQPVVSRASFDVGGGRAVSALRWGVGDPQFVLLHGGGQNAHTWDSVAMALGVPLLAVDLPGHGHSDWRADHDYGPVSNATAVTAVLEQSARDARAVIGMSLGGMTTIRLAAARPDLVRRAVIVDITPGGARRGELSREQRGATALLDGPKVFASFEEMLVATAAAVPGRPIESLRSGVLHNSRRRDDGRWVWRYDPERARPGSLDRDALWADVSAIGAPLMLVRGARSAMVDDDDVAELVRRQPAVRVEVLDAGHSVQSDQPLRLASLIEEFAGLP